MAWIVLLLVTTGPAPDQTPGWNYDYGASRREAAARNLPMLLVFDSPDAPHRHISKSAGAVSEQERKLLANYVRCHLDVSTEYGAKIAAAYKVTEYPHTVVIDRTGKYQVFVFRGEMDDTQWIAALTGYQPPPPRPLQRYCPP